MNDNDCQKYQRGDQWFCDRCRLCWGLDDDDPPDCSPLPVVKHKPLQQIRDDQIKEIRKMLDH